MHIVEKVTPSSYFLRREGNNFINVDQIIALGGSLLSSLSLPLSLFPLSLVRNDKWPFGGKGSAIKQLA